MPSTDHYPAGLIYREPFLKTFQSQTAMSSRHPRQAQRAPRPEAAKTAEGDTNCGLDREKRKASRDKGYNVLVTLVTSLKLGS